MGAFAEHECFRHICGGVTHTDTWCFDRYTDKTSFVQHQPGSMISPRHLAPVVQHASQKMAVSLRIIHR
jgi:hypothetical protein